VPVATAGKAAANTTSPASPHGAAVGESSLCIAAAIEPAQTTATVNRCEKTTDLITE
jgi:hypothetical protein